MPREEVVQAGLTPLNFCREEVKMQTELFCSHCDRKKANHLIQSNGENLTREIPTSGDVHSHPLPLKWVTSNDGGTYKPAQFPSP